LFADKPHKERAYNANSSASQSMGVPVSCRLNGDLGGLAQTRIGHTHMDESRSHSWVSTAVLLGIGYATVGIVFAVPTSQVQAWRLAAWAVSAIGYAAHIAYERFRLQNSPGSAALHVAFAVAIGAFGLAVGANIHSLSVGSSLHRHLLLLSLGVWPVMTALPAFLVAFGTNMVLARFFGRVDGSS